jgi:gas vesicle protein
VQPNIAAVQRRVRAADRGFAACVRAEPGSPPQCEALAAMMRAAAANPALRERALAQIAQLQALAIDRIARSHLSDRAPATFRVIVDPLVTWMWIGGLIALAGALLALWPSRGRRRGALVRSEADALKEVKYREIRDAELDHAAGKLSDEDFALLDAELRREAVEVLDRVEQRPKVPQG